MEIAGATREGGWGSWEACFPPKFIYIIILYVSIWR
jgi:hypothetical protein